MVVSICVMGGGEQGIKLILITMKVLIYMLAALDFDFSCQQLVIRCEVIRVLCVDHFYVRHCIILSFFRLCAVGIFDIEEGLRAVTNRFKVLLGSSHTFHLGLSF